MKPSEICKAAGLSSLAELVEMMDGEVTEATLINWHKSRPTVFKTLVIGAASAKLHRTISDK